MRLARTAAGLGLLLLVTGHARADDASPRLGVGMQIGAPWGHVAPLPIGVGARLVLTRHQAIDAGVGAPVATLGLGLWSDYQFSTHLGFVDGRLRDIEIYAGIGGQFGFLGPSYYARKNNAWVGFQYIYSSNGEVAVALRTPFGLRALFFARHVEVFAECETTFLAVPSREFLPGAAFGLRYYF